MTAVFQLFWNLCLLRLGPERMPTLGTFVIFVVAANFAVSALVGLSGPFAGRPGAALALPVLHAAVLGAGTWLVLLAKGLQARFTATFTALMGADALITLLSWPIALLLEPGAEPRAIDLVMALVQFALFFWWIAVAGFVFARALEVSRSQGVAVAAFVVLTSLMINASVFPPQRSDAPAFEQGP